MAGICRDSKAIPMPFLGVRSPPPLGVVVEGPPFVLGELFSLFMVAARGLALGNVGENTPGLSKMYESGWNV